jgi:hypothetical protein
MSYPAPVYVLSPILIKNKETNEELQLGRYISIIPKIEEFDLLYLDTVGEFTNGIGNQINPIIDTVVNGRSRENTIVNTEMKYDLVQERKDDIMMIGYVKEYRYSTQCQFLSQTDIDFTKLEFDINNQVETNKILKQDTDFVHKLDMKLLCSDNTLFFAYDKSEKNIDKNELELILPKFLSEQINFE